MDTCIECGTAFDDCNESQPVCPRCGGYRFTSRSDLDNDFTPSLTELVNPSSIDETY